MYVYDTKICFHDLCYDVADGSLTRAYPVVPDDAIFVSMDEALVKSLIKERAAICLPRPDPLAALHIMQTCRVRAQYCRSADVLNAFVDPSELCS